MKLWIARDKDGALHLFKNYKPYCFNGKWFNNKNMGGWYVGEIERNLFPEVTFENSPQEVGLKLTSEKISESIVNEFMNTLNFTYDKSEKCMSAKIYNTDLISLKNIIDSRLE